MSASIGISVLEIFCHYVFRFAGRRSSCLTPSENINNDDRDTIRVVFINTSVSELNSHSAVLLFRRTSFDLICMYVHVSTVYGLADSAGRHVALRLLCAGMIAQKFILRNDSHNYIVSIYCCCYCCYFMIFFVGNSLY